MAVQAGLSSSDASFLISVVGISNTVGRLVSGWLADLKWTSALGITIITTAAGYKYRWIFIGRIISSSSLSSLLSSSLWSALLVLACADCSVWLYNQFRADCQHSSSCRSAGHSTSQHSFWYFTTLLTCAINLV